MSLPEEGKSEFFCQKQFTLVQETCTSTKYCTIICDVQSPFSISKTKNNSLFEFELPPLHFSSPFLFAPQHVELFFSQQLIFETEIIALMSRVSSPFLFAPLHFTLSCTKGKRARILNISSYALRYLYMNSQLSTRYSCTAAHTLVHQHRHSCTEQY